MYACMHVYMHVSRELELPVDDAVGKLDSLAVVQDRLETFLGANELEIICKHNIYLDILFAARFIQTP
jgi:hypothetical protein